MDARLLTAEELGERLGMSGRKVLELAKSGRIPVVNVSQRIRRFDYAEVLEALKSEAQG